MLQHIQRLISDHANPVFKIAPHFFGRVQFRTVRWKENKGHVGWYVECFCMMGQVYNKYIAVAFPNPSSKIKCDVSMHFEFPT